MNAEPRSSDKSSPSVPSTLLRELRTHDPQAWERLVHLFSPLIYDWCRQQGLQAADAADVTQEVFQSVMRSLTGFRREKPGDSFRGWLWTITRNKVRDHHRTRRTRPDARGGTDAVQRLAMIADEEPSEPPSSAPESSLSHSPYQRALDLIRERFEERTWTAFWRVFIERDNTADVAADLGMTTGAVRKAKARVLRQLREDFGDLLE